MSDSPGGRLSAWWQRLSPLPGGSWVFSYLLRWVVPYTGSVRPHIRELRPGFARVTMRDRRGVRNHLNSIHAIALVNLGEVTSGLAMLMALPSETRSIVTGLSVEFLKKARGTLEATCRCEVPPRIIESTERTVIADIADGRGDVVARTTVKWRLSPPAS